MKRRIKHFWRYATSPSYRMFIDLMTSQEMVKRKFDEKKQHIELSSMHPVIAEQCLKYSQAYGISVMDAKQIIKANSGTN